MKSSRLKKESVEKKVSRLNKGGRLVALPITLTYPTTRLPFCRPPLTGLVESPKTKGKKKKKMKILRKTEKWCPRYGRHEDTYRSRRRNKK